MKFFQNLIADDLSGMSFFTQNKETFEIKEVSPSDNKWGNNPEMLAPQNIFTDDLSQVYDFCGGKRNKESYNFLIDLKESQIVEEIRFVSVDGYYPSLMNFYIGNDKEEIFSNSFLPIKEFKIVQNKGVYEFKCDSKKARFVRIEILDNINTYYGNMLVIPVAFMGVFGSKFDTATDNDFKTLLQPFLFKKSDGWTNEYYSSATKREFNNINLGSGYSNVTLKGGSIINIGLTDNPSLITEFRQGINPSDFEEIFFYIKSDKSGIFTFQNVSVCDQWFNSYFKLKADIWQKINLKGLMSDVKFEEFSKNNPSSHLKRIAISAPAGIEAEITVGSVVGKNRCAKSNQQLL